MPLRPEVLRLVLTALGAGLVLWQRLLLPVLLGLLVYAWSCLLADRLARRFGDHRAVATVSAISVGLMVILALAGEVYVLKAEVRRMRIALADRQVLDEQALEQASGSIRMNDWLKREEAEFGQALLRPFTHPDEAPNVSAAMRSR